MDVENLVSQLVTLINIVIIGTMTAGLSWFLHYLYLNTPIAKDYYAIIKKLYRLKKWAILKPLGYCVYCQGTWINLGYFVWFGWMNGYSFLGVVIFLPLSLGINYIMIEIMSIIIYRWGVGQ